LSDALSKVSEGLAFEFGPVENGTREFIVSADGDSALFPIVRRLVDRAPVMPKWRVIAFRPPRGVDFTINMGDQLLSPDDIWFTSQPDGDRVGLTLYIRGLSAANEDFVARASFLILDTALGEYAVETRVGFIEREPLMGSPAFPLRPLREISSVVTLAPPN
jgi:hypothetical protein